MKKIYIDYEKFQESEENEILQCSYNRHPDNKGIVRLREELAFLFACRRCEDYPCVNSCPNDALKRESGVIKRSSFICVSCKTCSIACPFGVILPEVIPYINSRCDACIGRLKNDEKPLCVESCKNGAVQYIEEDSIEDKTNLFELGDNILVRVFNWLNLYEIKK